MGQVEGNAPASVLDRPVGAGGRTASRALPPGWRERLRPWAEVGALLLGWRLALLLFAALIAELGVNWEPPTGAADFLDRLLTPWDGGWYLLIARDGYAIWEGGQHNVAFYPLLPLLIRAVYWIVPSWRFAGAIVVHAALVGAVGYLYALARLDHDHRASLRVVACLLCFPAAIFLTAVYTESLLLLALTAAIYHARRGQWWAAGLWGAAAGGTKTLGVVVLVPLAWEYWRGGWWRASRRPWRTLPALALVPLGAAAYFAYLHRRFGSFRVYFETQREWHRGSFFRPFFPDGLTFLQAEFAGRGQEVLNYFYPPGGTYPSANLFMIWDLLVLLGFAAIGIALCLRVRGSYGLFVLAALVMLAFSGSPQSFNRYVLALGPAFIGIALAARRPWLGVGLLVPAVFFQALHLFLYVNRLWAG